MESTVNDESTLGNEVLSGLLGAVVAVGCILPPLLHLVTGPLGPFIGGFVAANRSKPGLRGRIVIALTIGTVVTSSLGTLAAALVRFVGRSQLPTWFPAPATLAAILAGVWIYSTALGAGGTAVSASFSRSEKEQPS
jgi:hypothetical protein